MKVLILGNGVLGSNLLSFYKKKNIKCKLYSEKFNKNNLKKNKKKFIKIIKDYKPDSIINCIAIRDQDLCETNPKKAYFVNSQIVKIIINIIKKLNFSLHFIQISTDQVYSNENKALKENEINPKNIYAKSKFLGETYAHQNIQHTVIRTNFCGNSAKKDKPTFSDWIILNIRKNKEIYLSKKINFNPINITLLMNIIIKIIKKKIYGTYNIGSKNKVSKYCFGVKVCKNNKLNYNLIRPLKKSYSNKIRSKGTFMNIEKIEKRLKFKFPKLEEKNNKI